MQNLVEVESEIPVRSDSAKNIRIPLSLALTQGSANMSHHKSSFSDASQVQSAHSHFQRRKEEEEYYWLYCKSKLAKQRTQN